MLALDQPPVRLPASGLAELRASIAFPELTRLHGSSQELGRESNTSRTLWR